MKDHYIGNVFAVRGQGVGVRKVKTAGLVTRCGAVMITAVPDGPHRVDGQEIDYEAWPLYEAPGVEGAVGTGRVVFRRDEEELELDFGVDPQGPMLPMRVIG